MSKFITLIKRDIADYKGALIITPLAIAGFVIGMILLSIFTGNMKIDGESFSFFGGNSNIHASYNDDYGNQYSISKNSDGKFIITDEAGNQSTLSSTQSDKTGVKSQNIAFATGIGALIPLSVASIVVLFLLAGSLYDERKDKSIMFWKSLPISDGETVVSKMVSIVGVGLGVGFLVSVFLQVFIAVFTYIVSYSAGLFPINLLAFSAAIGKFCAIGFVGILAYILWAFPVYSWIVAASAYAPKAPFLLAFVPLFLLPLVGKIFFSNLVIENLFFEPLIHLSGAPVWQAVGSHTQFMGDEIINLGDEIAYILATLAQPSLIIGLLIGAGFLYGASQIRRTRSF